MDNFTYLYNRRTVMATFNDQECVAALNSCLDLEKWRALPSGVQDRIKNLMKHHRIKAVCFMDEEGFGLRVFKDELDFSIVTNADEATLTQINDRNGRVNLDGWWVRCPANLFQEKKEYMVMDKRGRSFYALEVKDTSGNEYSDEWVSRLRGFKFISREKAEALAAQVNGIVVEA